MTDQSIEDASRSEFEAKFKNYYLGKYPETRDYINSETAGAWEGWQAARQSSQSEPVAEVYNVDLTPDSADGTYCHWFYAKTVLPIGAKIYLSAPIDNVAEALKWALSCIDVSDWEDDIHMSAACGKYAWAHHVLSKALIPSTQAKKGE
jgi:hypothetical protein